jgi:hypothetical protein
MGRMEDPRFNAGLQGSALLVELVVDIDMRNDQDEDLMLYEVLSAAWPTRQAQDH